MRLETNKVCLRKGKHLISFLPKNLTDTLKIKPQTNQ